MRFIHKVFFSFLIISIFSFSANAQIKNFTFGLSFIDELYAYFDAGSANKGDAKDFVRIFEAKWKVGKDGVSYFSERQRQACFEVCNLMLKKKIRPPDFQSYLTCMINFVESKQTEKNFMAWQDCINKILSGKAIKSYTEFLTMSENLFADNTFYFSNTFKWRSSNSNYEFLYDSVPKVNFPALTLSCHNANGDSVVIINTKGAFFPATGKFIGAGGKVTWLKAGIDENIIYAEIKKYEIVAKTGAYTADSVVFYNKSYFNKPLMGQLTDKALAEAGGLISYPRFESYSKRLQIANIYENVDYDGGFSMRGPKFIGSGNDIQDAYLYFKRAGKNFLTVGSKTFFITKEKVTSDNANIRIYIEKDSIYHPGLSFKYISADKIISLIRSDDGLQKTAFSNSYHALDMNFEELTWKTDEPQLKLKMLLGNTQGEADFESSNFFKAQRYDQYMSMDGSNPLVAIRNFVYKDKDQHKDDKAWKGNREFIAEDLARFMKVTLNQLRPLLITLASQGFIEYFPIADKILVRDRLFQYITNRTGRTDYDVLNFHSVIPGQANGLINLLTNDLTISGVTAILLSDSQNVVIYPKNQTVVVKKNRDFSFAGRIHAGRFDFYGKTFSFEYDAFKINLVDVDSIGMKVRALKPDERGEFPLVKVKSVIEHMNGELEIDNPRNKSGFKGYSQYPVLKSSKDSYVYYDRRSIQKGVYNKDKFYFHLEPFVIDSLDNFTNEGIAFNGDFVSAGIFPQFKETLRLQPDYSLGFVRTTPGEGFAVYGDKAKFNDTIRLSHEGLRGGGVINFVTSTSISRDFIFFPDSTNGTAHTFDIKDTKNGKIEFPQVKGEDVYVHYLPKKEIMQVYSQAKPFVTYDGKAKFIGRYDLTPQLLSGNGKVDFEKAELEAKLIKFKQTAFDSDTADFRLQSLSESQLAFSTNNVNAHVDFAKREGQFITNGKGSIIKFPVNQYICFMESFKWFMDRSDIELGSGTTKAGAATDIDLQGPEFISVHPKQDSLRFNAPRAKYDLKNNIITAMEVKHINVADAQIIPDSGRVIIRREAKMETLNNAKIIANTVNKYHTIYNGVVNIFARKSYSGSGYYDYVDEIKKVQTVYFSSVSVDTTFQTFAETDIKDSSHFTLSPNFEYKGKAKLLATKKSLTFTGATRILHTCDKIPKTWFKFSAEIDPNKILIPVDTNVVDDKGNPLGTGVLLTNDSIRVYSAFLSKKVGKLDAEVMSAQGYLYYDKKAKEYKIASQDKLTERNTEGNYVSLNIDRCLIYAEGKVNMGTDFGQVKLQTVGNAQHFLIPDSTSFDLMMLVDFFFDDNAMEKMAQDIDRAADLKPYDFARPNYEKGLKEIMGKEKSDKLISQVNLYGQFKKFPDELKKAIFFTELKMKWNTGSRSYLSSGKIGIGNINKTQLNKYVEGKSRMELVKKRVGDILTIYIEIDASTWYYFSYARGLMKAVSSNEAFNTVIKELKPEKREVKKEKGEQPYVFNLAASGEKDRFLKKTGGAQGMDE